MEILFELSRIIKAGGRLLLRTPNFLGVKEGDEGLGLSPAEAIRRFGDSASCRLYCQKDLLQRCKETGFIRIPFPSDIREEMETEGYYLFEGRGV